MAAYLIAQIGQLPGRSKKHTILGYRLLDIASGKTLDTDIKSLKHAIKTKSVSIVVTNAISPTVSKVVTAMSKEEFRNEKLYQTTMHLARKMLEEGIISEEEYRQIDTIFLEKYKPVFGTLFSDISLTSKP